MLLFWNIYSLSCVNPPHHSIIMIRLLNQKTEFVERNVANHKSLGNQ